MGKNLESMYFILNGERTQFLFLGRLAALLLHFQSDIQETNTHTCNYFSTKVERTGYVTTSTVCAVANIYKDKQTKLAKAKQLLY